MAQYIGQVLEDGYTPEAAAWCNENCARIDNVDGQFVIVSCAAHLDDRKLAALDHLKVTFNQAEENLVITSSLGFRIDANSAALQEIGAKREFLGAMCVDVEDRFCDADNVIHTLVYNQFNTVFSEIVQARDSLREEKWRLREAINGADTDAALDAIRIGFDTDKPYKPV